jgi:hypothetical protein
VQNWASIVENASPARRRADGSLLFRKGYALACTRTSEHGENEVRWKSGLFHVER